jgi:hypothetical protein
MWNLENGSTSESMGDMCEGEYLRVVEFVRG